LVLIPPGYLPSSFGATCYATPSANAWSAGPLWRKCEPYKIQQAEECSEVTLSFGDFCTGEGDVKNGGNEQPTIDCDGDGIADVRDFFTKRISANGVGIAHVRG